MAANNAKEGKAETVRVWDIGVRAFHWLFAGGIFAELAIGYLAPPSALTLHVWIGYLLLALVAFRLTWGFTGSTFARFSAFPLSIRAAFDHVSSAHKPGLGHNPLGAWMVHGLLGASLVMIATGLAALGGVERLGPVAALFSVEGGQIARAVHQLGAIALCLMIAAHLAGVMFESRREKLNLARAMVTGLKPAQADATPVHHPRPLATVVTLSGVLVAVFAGLFAVSRLPQPRIPTDAPLSAWVEECGACHTPHHPSLLPASAWKAIMAGLPDHFGEDASLPEATNVGITAWLEANAADRFDTKAAILFLKPDPAEPLRITRTAGWKSIHGELPQALFKSAKIASPANCGACHTDAVSGRFIRSAIKIPSP